jgi:hypothetical protein
MLHAGCQRYPSGKFCSWKPEVKSRLYWTYQRYEIMHTTVVWIGNTKRNLKKECAEGNLVTGREERAWEVQLYLIA